MPTFIRLPALSKRLAISIRTVHDRIRTDAHFPKPVKLGPAPHSPLGFVLAEVEAYEARLMSARDPSGAAPAAAVGSQAA